MSLLRLAYQCPIAVIGDIHGKLSLLTELLETVKDRPVLVTGDVCDRGEDTKGVIDALITRGAQGVNKNGHLERFPGARSCVLGPFWGH